MPDVPFVLRGQVAVLSIVVLQAGQGHPVTLFLVAWRAEQGEVVVGVAAALRPGPYVVDLRHPGVKVLEGAVGKVRLWHNTPYSLAINVTRLIATYVRTAITALSTTRIAGIPDTCW